MGNACMGGGGGRRRGAASARSHTLSAQLRNIEAGGVRHNPGSLASSSGPGTAGGSHSSIGDSVGYEEPDFASDDEPEDTGKELRALRRSSQPFDIFRHVGVKELSAFHDQISAEFKHKPSVFDDYLRAVATAQSRGGLQRRARILFRGHPHLLARLDEILENGEEKGDAIAVVFTPDYKVRRQVPIAETRKFLAQVQTELGPRSRRYARFVSTLRDFEDGKLTRSECSAAVLRVFIDAGRPGLIDAFEDFVKDHSFQETPHL